MDRNTNEEVPRRCPICQNTGFRDGQICPCIAGKGIDLPEGWADIFGDAFHHKSAEKEEK